MTTPYYQSLDGLRGIAVCIVLLAHARAPFIRNGGVGVDIFFTLSGFLITGLLLNEYGKYKSISIKNFYARRSLRLIPCLWLAVVFYILVSSQMDSVGDSQPFNDAVFALTYSMNWARAVEIGGAGHLGHTWSLAIEEQYYLLWPFAILLLCKMVSRDIQRAMLLGATAIIVILLRAVMVDTWSPARIYNGLDTHSDGLLLGSALACLTASGSHWTSKLRVAMKLLISPIAVVVLLYVAAELKWSSRQMGYWGFAVCAIASAAIILDLVSGASRWLGYVLSIKWLRFLGKISYGIYLWHYPIFGIIQSYNVFYGWKRTLLIGGLLSVIVAASSYFLVEQKFLRWKARFVRSDGFLPAQLNPYPKV